MQTGQLRLAGVLRILSVKKRMPVRFLLVFFLLQIPGISVRAQNSLILLPSGLTFQPLRANTQEARVGVFKFTDASDMKVDIGNTIDVAGYHFASDSLIMTIGIDFMAYARTVGTEGLRLQIDAIDGFFGGNMSCSKAVGSSTASARLRILHHSAHLVDGHYVDGRWTDNGNPIPFTKDYGELVGAGMFRESYGVIRIYGGVSYATLVRPAGISRFAYLGGTEAAFENAAGRWNDTPLTLYVAWNISLDGTPAYTASNTLQAGIKLGRYIGKGPTLYLAYYNGMNMFAEYFNERVTTIGAGFTVDFF